ncbi:MAG: DUF3786 domain-containing protein [Oscillospiraceae bacterium]|jgi:hypothetical protein|nr:DUF3786 domain-containing protein [Oscillospiraceae bacterium]MCI9588770.1 DUF3786 domain-containing protein [Oscillospiraceae bacterium]
MSHLRGNYMNNYQIQAENAKKLFLGYDQEEIIRKLRLEHDEDYLYLPFLDLQYRVHRRTAAVERREGTGAYEDGGSFNEVLTIFDALCWSKEGVQLSGEWRSTAALGNQVHGGSLFQGFREQAARMDPERLPAVLEAMGGLRMPKGEPGYRLMAFPFLPVYFQYWRSDEEFPAQINLFWDKNTTDIIHYETVYYLSGFLMERIITLLGRDGREHTERENGYGFTEAARRD